MKRSLKAALAGVMTLATAGAGLAAMTATAYAAPTVPPWEPDAQAAAPYGNVAFYDANGNQVTSGTNLSNPFAYAVATTPGDAGSVKATLAFYKPVFASPPNPQVWPGVSEGGPTAYSPATSLPAGTPASVAAFAPTYPVVKASANISSFASAEGTDPTAGYTNMIEVRMQDTALFGSQIAYWDTDIAYNTTASPITVNGVTVPANGWAQVFPQITATTTSLTTSATGGTLVTGNPITLTATVPASDPGSVNFFDNGTFLGNSSQSSGTATFNYTPAQGNHSYTATFVPGPPPGDESGLNTSSANVVGGSTSSAVNVSDNPPQTGTSTSLSAGSTSINFGQSDTFTATVTSADNNAAGVAGSVQFMDGTTALGSPVATTVSGTTGTAQLATSSLPQGSNSITAVFTPTSNSYATSTSAPVVVQVAAPAACSLTGSSCSDTQNIQVTINPGTLTITTPYTSSNPFVLPAMTLSADGTYFQSSATFPSSTLPQNQQIVVTSSLAPAYAWTLSVAATPLSSSAGGTIPASGLGLTKGTLLNSTGTGAYPGTVTFKDIPALNPSPVDGPGTGPGLSSTPQTFATSTAADGTAVMDGTLTLFAATNTPAGTYNGTITFSVS